MILGDVQRVISAGLAFLPERFNSPEARAMLLAIGLQESGFRFRRQMGDGPARGYWQFEQSGGVAGVMRHPQTSGYALDVARRLDYPFVANVLWAGLEHNDVLAVVFARLNLFWLPSALPGRDECERAWRQYLSAWRPGQPHAETWASYFSRAWDCVDKG